MKRANALHLKEVDGRGELGELFRIRHDAYLGKGLIEKQVRSFFFDTFDFTNNSRQLAVYRDKFLIAAVRLHLVRSKNDPSPSLEFFPEILDRPNILGEGVIDYTRLIAETESVRESTHAKFLLFEHSFRIALNGGGRYAIAPVKSKHINFYKRMRNFEDLPFAPRPMLQINDEHHLLILDFHRNAKLAEAKFEDMMHEKV